MGQLEIELETGIDAPAGVIWHLLTDWENLGEWMTEASAFQVTTPFREGVGVEATARIKIGPLSTVDSIRVSKWEPPHLLEITHLGWVKGAGLLRVIQADGSNKLYWRESYSPPWGLIGAIGMRLYSPFMRRTFEKDLALLKKLAEERTSK